jgi:hypothetical protein
MSSPNLPCTATTKAGQPCRAYAVSGSTLCLSHDPSRRAAAQSYRRTGGLHRRRPRDVPDAPQQGTLLATPEGLWKAWNHAMAVTLRCDMSLAQARMIASLIASAIQLREHIELQDRIAGLEAALRDLSLGRAA